MSSKLSLNAMVLDISSQLSRIERNSDEFVKYSTLLEYLEKKDYFNQEHFVLPKVQDITKELNISYHNFRKQIENIYNILIDFDFNDNHSFDVKTTSVYFYLSSDSTKKGVAIKANGIKFLPRKGEIVELMFYSAIFSFRYFYVDDVSTAIYDNECIISVMLKEGFYNSYWELRKDRAFEIGELPIINLSDKEYELKKKLNENPRNAW